MLFWYFIQNKLSFSRDKENGRTQSTQTQKKLNLKNKIFHFIFKNLGFVLNPV